MSGEKIGDRVSDDQRHDGERGGKAERAEKRQQKNPFLKKTRPVFCRQLRGFVHRGRIGVQKRNPEHLQNRPKMRKQDPEDREHSQ